MWKRSENEPFEGPGAANPNPVSSPAPPPRPAAPRSEAAASIGPSITIKGDVSGEENLVVQGRVEGTIDLKQNNVTVGKHGRVKADIHGRVIDVEGEVEGNLFGDEQVVVRQSGAVRGNITAPRVSLEDGANFKGTIDMGPKEKSGGKPGGREAAPSPLQEASPRPGPAPVEGRKEGGAGLASGEVAQKALPTGSDSKPGAAGRA